MLWRLALKTTTLFLLFNLLLAASYPLEKLGSWSLYNLAFPGRTRLPYGEDPATSYNLSLNNVPALLESHQVSAAPLADEFRVFVLGDSSTWGWFLPADQTLASHLNQLDLATADGRPLRFYNLGYPVMSLTKDVLLLDAALPYQPDLIIWLVTLESFPHEKQLVSPLVQHNPHRLEPILPLDTSAEAWVRPSWLERTLWGQRRPLADLLRLQLLGAAWAATGIDQAIPAQIPLRQRDLSADPSWQSHPAPRPLDEQVLAWDVLAAGIRHAGSVPVLLINEPIYQSDGANSDLRYNSLYPRWAYDDYRGRLQATAEANNWPYLDWWDTLPPEAFTDTPVHLTPFATAALAQKLGAHLTPTR